MTRMMRLWCSAFKRVLLRAVGSHQMNAADPQRLAANAVRNRYVGNLTS